MAKTFKISGVFLFVFVVLFFILIFTEIGLFLAFQSAQYLAPTFGAKLNVENSSGFFAQKINIAHLMFEKNNQKTTIKNLNVEWNPIDLTQFPPKLNIEHFSIDSILIENNNKENNNENNKINNKKDENNQNLEKLFPQNLDFSFLFQIKNLTVGSIFYQKEKIIENLKFSLDTTNEENNKIYKIKKLSFNYKKMALNLKANLNSTQPFNLNASLKINGDLSEKFSLLLNADLNGNLKEVNLKINTQGALNSFVEADLKPFSKIPLEKMQVSIQNFNPQVLNGIHANLNLNADVIQQDSALLGKLKINNKEKDLPIEKIKTNFVFKDEKINLNDFSLSFFGNSGKIKGDAFLDFKQNINANFKIASLNLKGFSKNVPKTDVAGYLKLRGHFQNFEAELNLKNNLENLPLLLKSKMEFKDEYIYLMPLILNYKEGSLQGNVGFSLKNKKLHSQFNFNKLNLNEFAKGTILNGNLILNGDLNQVLFKTDLDIDESQLWNEKLNGKGFFYLKQNTIEKANLNLNWGGNYLKLNGSFGKIGKHQLDLKFNAPQFVVLDYTGHANIDAQIMGNLKQTELILKADIPQLKNKKGFLLKNLKADLKFGSFLKSSLIGQVRLDLLNVEKTPQLLREFNLNLKGTNQNHQIDLKARLPKREYIEFNIKGGFQNDLFKTLLWNGSIDSLRYYHRTRGGYMILPNNKIIFGEKKWSIKNLNIKTEDGSKFKYKLPFEAVFNAAGDLKKTKLNFDLNNLNKNNKINLNAEWQNQNELFKINSRLPWKINLLADLNEMQWLSSSVGENWELGGKTFADFKISGSLDKPMINGYLKGENLKLAQNDFLLHLKEGMVDLNIQNNLLNLNQFYWKSVLQKPPALLLNRPNAENILKLTENEGEMRALGSLRLFDENNNAQLEVALRRLGIIQLADQWLLLSGDAKMQWEKETLALDGNLKMDAGFWQIKSLGTPSPSNDVVVRKTTEDAAMPKIIWQPNVHLRIDMGEHFMFAGYGLNTLLTGKLDIFAQGKDLPRAQGRIVTQGGRFEAYGQKLFIRQGRLTFDNLVTNPSLDIEALRFGGKIAAGVKVLGSAERPEIVLISEPNVPDAEKLSWLILGHGPEEMSLGDAALLLSAADGLLGGNSGSLSSQITNIIGIDDFNISQGNLNGNKRRITSRVVGSMQDSTAANNDQILTIGKRLTDQLRLSYEQSLGQADSLLRLFTRLKYGIFLIVSTGSDNTLDFYYRSVLGKPPMQKENN